MTEEVIVSEVIRISNLESFGNENKGGSLIASILDLMHWQPGRIYRSVFSKARVTILFSKGGERNTLGLM